MGSPVNIDLDVLLSYQEDQGNNILEAAATGAGVQMTIISNIKRTRWQPGSEV